MRVLAVICAILAYNVFIGITANPTPAPTAVLSTSPIDPPQNAIDKPMPKPQNVTDDQQGDRLAISDADEIDGDEDIDQLITEGSGTNPGAGAEDIDDRNVSDEKDDSELHKDYGNDNDDNYDDEHDASSGDNFDSVNGDDEVEGLMDDELNGGIEDKSGNAVTEKVVVSAVKRSQTVNATEAN